MNAPLCCRRVERHADLAASSEAAEGVTRDSADADSVHDLPADARAGRSADTPADPPADGATAPEIAGTITLDETDRHRRRMAMKSDQGLAFVLTLDAPTLLRDGDRLVLDDGRRIVVRAAPEPLYEVRASDPHHLLRLAWHMGNRHLPTQLMDGHLRIRRDAVIGAMLAGLGAEISEVEAGFDPEGGAYGDAHGHTHGDGARSHGRRGSHAHGRDHVHGHARGHALDHEPTDA